MYTLKPVFSLTEPLHPAKIMYELKNIHEDLRKGDHARKTIALDIKKQAPHPEVSNLEKRQEKILGQLAELKKIISSLSDMIKETNQSYIIANTKCKDLQDPVVIDLIIKTKCVPYSLIAVAHVWKDTKFNISCYRHSDSDLRKSDNTVFFEKILQNNNYACNQTEPKKGEVNGQNIINLTLIWKNVNTMEVIKGTMENTFLGEINLLRYLSRMISSHNYENMSSINEVIEIDTMLDYCYQLTVAQSEKEMYKIAAKFADALKTDRMWLVSKEKPTIADFATWSVIKNHFKKELPTEVMNWFDRCQKTFLPNGLINN